MRNREQILELVQRQNLSQAEAARRIGISRERVRQLCDKMGIGKTFYSPNLKWEEPISDMGCELHPKCIECPESRCVMEE